MGNFDLMRENELFFKNILEHFVGILRIEWRESKHHFVQQGSEAINIHTEIMSFFKNHLRRHVSR